jgi:hypothetical protein
LYGLRVTRPSRITSGLRVIRPGHWERAQISEMGIIGS